MLHTNTNENIYIVCMIDVNRKERTAHNVTKKYTNETKQTREEKEVEAEEVEIEKKKKEIKPDNYLHRCV